MIAVNLVISVYIVVTLSRVSGSGYLVTRYISFMLGTLNIDSSYVYIVYYNTCTL